MNCQQTIERKHFGGSFRASSRQVMTGALAGGLLFLMSAMTPETVSAASACADTTKAAFNACQHEVQDDFWVTRGNCRNLSGVAVRKSCMKTANRDRNEARDLCKAQRVARGKVCKAIGPGRYDPQLDPSRFVNPAHIGTTVAPNPYLPLIPGKTWVYENASDGETITVTVTTKTRVILGITAVEVHDFVQKGGVTIEDTDDWLAQDIDGNVWYLGEISRNYEDGRLVSLDGSWVAGMDGAKQGIVMQGTPVVGKSYRQEFFLGDAEDMGKVLDLAASETTPAASCTGDCLKTKDYTPLDPEPDAVEHKYYKPGVGFVLEIKPSTGERLELKSVTP